MLNHPGAEISLEILRYQRLCLAARPKLQATLNHLREGDRLIVHSLDRLARYLVDLKNIVSNLTGRGVVVEFVKEHLTFSSEDNAMNTPTLLQARLFADGESWNALSATKAE
jgi:DNA invertase Pin-like site-specific DNA recombinase